MSRVLRHAALLAAGAVGLSAAVATAHGVFELVTACGVPPVVAGLYPLITDGLALVGYATALRLPSGHRRWAWAVVILAAGLSGVGQATLLGGGVERPPTWLRFGVGAWPAIAAALVAHLLFLMATSRPSDGDASASDTDGRVVQAASNQLDEGPSDISETEPWTAALLPAQFAAPAKERALATARAFHARTDALPTVSELAVAAGVARGTAATALRELRSQASARSGAAGERAEESR